ncbi:MAG: GNAT family N-acetyltransferase [Candidatus Omnitrophica bacterium]|nr:GNAT family N-acetyltransferase [Candidatus Omnitrophota bacterium]
MRIRQANKQDINQMADLLEVLFLIESDFTINRDKQMFGLRMLIDDPSKGIVFVADNDGKVIAMCALHYVISTAQGGVVGLIEDMIVKVNHRHKGIGSKLLERIIEYARVKNLSRIQLLADKDNHIALKFYEKMQFKNTKLIALRLMV